MACCCWHKSKNWGDRTDRKSRDLFRYLFSLSLSLSFYLTLSDHYLSLAVSLCLSAASLSHCLSLTLSRLCYFASSCLALVIRNPYESRRHTDGSHLHTDGSRRHNDGSRRHTDDTVSRFRQICIRYRTALIGSTLHSDIKDFSQVGMAASSWFKVRVDRIRIGQVCFR
eukprot:sb/3472296/